MEFISAYFFWNSRGKLDVSDSVGEKDSYASRLVVWLCTSVDVRSELTCSFLRVPSPLSQLTCLFLRCRAHSHEQRVP